MRSSQDQAVGAAIGQPVAGAGELLVDRVRAAGPQLQEQLVRTIGVRVDPAMRIEPVLQIARAITLLPEARDSELLTPDARRLLQLTAEAGGCLPVQELSPAAHWLLARGFLFAHPQPEGSSAAVVPWLLVAPAALMLQLKPWEGEDPRGARALLYQTSDEVKATIASYYLGRPATRPLSLPLERAWHTLTRVDFLSAELVRLSSAESKLLGQIEELGGEVDTAELLELEREPLRLRSAVGPTAARRGVGYALERRGFLIPLHPNRHVIPTEVARCVGSARQAARAKNRQAIRQFVMREDHAPRRARFASHPTPLAFALALVAQAIDRDLQADAAVPRSWITRQSTRFGRDGETVALLVALSRAIGLWDDALGDQGPPADCSGDEIAALLFDTWYRGGVWNEAHPAGDPWRSGRVERGCGAISVLRTLVLEALSELGDGRWVPWEAIAGYLRTDERAAGLTRLVQRWATRVGVEAQPIAEIARRMTLESLHALGVVDLGDGNDDDADADLGTMLRVTPRGRHLLAQALELPTEGSLPSPEPKCSEVVPGHVLRIGSEARWGQVRALAPFVELQAVTPALELRLSSATLGGALAQGYELEEIGARLSSLATVPEATARLLQRTGAVLGSADYQSCSGFLRVPESELRELLLGKRPTTDLFLHDSPPGGLLIAPAVDFEQLVRRCRVVGVEVTRDGRVSRTGSTLPPPLQSGAVPSGRRQASARPRAAKR